MALPYQKREIWKLCNKDNAYKTEMVQAIAGDDSITEVDDLTFDQANNLINQLGGQAQSYKAFGYFDFNNSQHKYILSLCYQLQWTEKIGGKPRPDIHKLGVFIAKRTKAKTPLQQQESNEVSDTILSLEAVLRHQK